jgi:hypothetical protein
MKPYKLVKMGSVVRKVVTVAGFARIINRSVETVRKMEDRGVLPPSNFRMPSAKDGRDVRIYTIELAEDIKVIMEEVTQGRAITGEQRQRIAAAFANEKQLIENDAKP